MQSILGVFSCCAGVDRKRKGEENLLDIENQIQNMHNDDSLNQFSSAYEESVTGENASLRNGNRSKAQLENKSNEMQQESAQRRNRNQKKKKKKKGIRKSDNYDYETPGGDLKEEAVTFNHQYYENSIAIIDLLLLGEDKEIRKRKLNIDSKVSNVFYEEPLEYDNFLQKSLNKQTRKDQDWRKQMEKKKYLEIIQDGNDSEQLYLISASWIKKWTSFISKESGYLPGEIMNDELYNKLDSKPTLKIGEDVFFISQKLWNAFFDWYQGGPTLKWKIEVEQSPAEESNRPSQLSPDNQADYKHNHHNSDDKFDFKILARKTNKDIIGGYNEEEKVQQKLEVSSKRQHGSIDVKNGPKFLKNGMDIADFAKPASNLNNKGDQKIFKPNYQEEEFPTKRPTESERESEEPSQIIQIQEKKPRSDVVRVFGLENNSLYCYLNAVLQCLFAIDELRDFYEKGDYKKIKIKTPIVPKLKFATFMSEFAADINKAQKKSNFRVLKTGKLKSIMGREFSPVREQDSHEFLLYLLNNLKDELTEKGTKFSQNSKNGLNILWKEYTKSFPSQVDKLFTSIEKTQITCNSCKKEAESLQFHLCLPLQIEGIKSINQSLKLFSYEEEISDYKCEFCKKKFNSSLKRKIIKLPQVFIFQLQRFSMFPRLRKIRGVIEYPEYLDMEKFIESEYQRESCNQPYLYQLIAVAVHLGTIHGGHYVSYAKKEDNAWYYMDDERVSKVSKQEVLSQDAYLLFYKKIQN